MSQEAKRIKICTLIELVAGLVLIGYAIVAAICGMAPAICGLLGADGVVALVFGGRAALIANVPARIAKLVGLSLAIMLVEVAVVCGLVALIGPDKLDENPLPVIFSGLVAVLSLVILVLSRACAKRAER